MRNVVRAAAASAAALVTLSAAVTVPSSSTSRRAAGRTTVKLLFCPHGLCGSAAEVSASPVPTATHTAAPTKSDDQVAYYVYTITVR
ncbi:hypothetical protein OG758_26980 [Streptomyces sp. NBC_01474]|uniref:hypothetical protein n=1 Tax=Streptomyces sp. NBC_01474 TaxID=2903880 RepID=UPI002DDB1E80|nr:hypothetical protein [Streptomyces sp. NBC_01474]WSD97472.1 hypothetical protein OG758_26980 [Streptomyces sp. NBC_01474]